MLLPLNLLVFIILLQRTEYSFCYEAILFSLELLQFRKNLNGAESNFHLNESRHIPKMIDLIVIFLLFAYCQYSEFAHHCFFGLNFPGKQSLKFDSRAPGDKQTSLLFLCQDFNC